MTTDAPPEKMMLGDLPCPACGGRDDAIGLANIAKFCWEDAKAEIRELTEALGVSRQMRDEDWLVIAKLRYDCAEWKRRALFAPPAASADERTIPDEVWEVALRCAASQFESYARQNKLASPEERRVALSDALQHAVGIIQLKAPLR